MANHYITPSGAGRADGTDWNNAFADIPATLTRGDTYYFASGSYIGYYAFTTAVSGTTYIYFKKATASDHGTDTGWVSGYGVGQASWYNPGGACWDIRTSYLSFDGNSWVGPRANTATSQYGFKLSSSYTGSAQVGCINVWYGYTANGIVVKGVEIQGNGTNTDGVHRLCGLYTNSVWRECDSWVFQNNYVHDCDAWIQGSCLTQITIDHCYFQNAGSNAAEHGCGIAISGDGITIRFSVLENMIGLSNTTYIEPQGNAGSGNPTLIPGGWAIYGNIYLATSPSEYTAQWANFSVTSNNYMNGVQFYNNVSYGLHGPVGVSAGNIDGSTGFVVQNNVWLGCSVSDGCQRVGIVDHNITVGITTGYDFGDYHTAPSFVNPSGGDFHLTAQTTPVGDDLGSPYNVDPDGAIRTIGAASIGAFQYVPSGGSGTATVVRVETAADGSGSVVPAQNISSGSSITVYAISRDASGHFVSNVAADSWSLTGVTGGVASGDLVAAGGSKSAVFTGHAAGSAAVHVVSGVLTPTDSGTLTVISGGGGSGHSVNLNYFVPVLDSGVDSLGNPILRTPLLEVRAGTAGSLNGAGYFVDLGGGGLLTLRSPILLGPAQTFPAGNYSGLVTLLSKLTVSPVYYQLGIGLLGNQRQNLSGFSVHVTVGGGLLDHHIPADGWESQIFWLSAPFTSATSQRQPITIQMDTPPGGATAGVGPYLFFVSLSALTATDVANPTLPQGLFVDQTFNFRGLPLLWDTFQECFYADL